MRDITVRYSAVDGYAQTRRFKTLAGAQKFAHRYLGEHPEYYERSWYAVSFDGVGKVTVDGATLAEIFPPREETTPMVWDAVEGWVEDGRVDPNPIHEDTYCPSKGATHDTPESLSADGGLRWPDDCPF